MAQVFFFSPSFYTFEIKVLLKWLEVADVIRGCFVFSFLFSGHERSQWKKMKHTGIHVFSGHPLSFKAKRGDDRVKPKKKTACFFFLREETVKPSLSGTESSRQRDV